MIKRGTRGIGRIVAVFSAFVFSLCAFSAAGLGNYEPVMARDADNDVVIFIDAGHGGYDPGKVGVTGVREDLANYAIAEAMKNELEKYEGIKVFLTRPEDFGFTNTGRAMMAASLNADFLISLHNNSGTETSAGSIVYTSLIPLYSGITADMGNNILENLSELGLVNNGIQTRASTEYEGEDYYTIIAEGVRAGVPTIIVEHCFLSNPSDSLFVAGSDGIVDKEKTEKLGVADANAVVRYFGLHKRTAVADSTTTLSLERGYSVLVSPGNTATGSANWISSNENVVTVDEYGFATAVNSGKADVMYTYTDGTSGYLTIEVKVPEQLALVGAIDPTFYNTAEKFAALDTGEIVGNVIYSDGSVKRVNIDNVGDIDFDKLGVQDIDISYGTLNGKLRVCYNPEGYVPEEVTSRPEVEYTEPETTEEVITMGTYESSVGTDESDPTEITIKIDLMMIIKVAVAIVIVVIFATLIYIIENSVGKKKRNNRRRRRY